VLESTLFPREVMSSKGGRHWNQAVWFLLLPG
jgi:hypothetical protein